MEDKGNKGKKFSYMNSVSSHQADQDEGNKMPKTTSFLTSSSSCSSGEDEEKQIEEMSNFNQENEETPNDWVIRMENSTKNNQWRPSFRRCCIYRAHALRDVDIAAFTPKIVSIGPLHYSDKHLKRMEDTKIKYLEHFLQHADNTARLNEQLGLTSLEEQLNFLCWKDIDQMETANKNFSCLVKFRSLLKSLEQKIRSSYSENFHFSNEKFLRIILVDAAFIIELFLRHHFQSNNDALVSTAFLSALIRCDLWQLENQLPFFVLQKLYHTAFGSYPEIYPPFLELTCKVFQLYNVQGKVSIKAEVNHFTDLLRTFCLPADGNFQEDEPKGLSGMFGHLPSATQLHAAGVKFSASKSKCLLDIKFSNGRLEIPSLDLFDETGELFRNLIALEQYHYPETALISDYFTFMDYLVDTSNDADLLVEKKIIKHWLGSGKEVASLFNSLCVNILKGRINQRYYRLIEELNKYHDQPWHSCKATLKSQYFSTLWRSASTIAAIILLVLTLIQTILSGIAL